VRNPCENRPPVVRIRHCLDHAAPVEFPLAFGHRVLGENGLLVSACARPPFRALQQDSALDQIVKPESKVLNPTGVPNRIKNSDADPVWYYQSFRTIAFRLAARHAVLAEPTRREFLSKPSATQSSRLRLSVLGPPDDEAYCA
jgi:hypothetical protein